MGRKTTASVVNTLKELLGRPSDYRDEKKPVVSFVKGWLEDLGMDVSVHGEKSMPAICATNGEGGVVPIGPPGHRSGRGQVDEGARRGRRRQDHGRGSADMKGAVASMLHASTELMKEDVVFSVFLTTDEEEKMTGAFALSELDLLWKARGVLIGEPTDLLPAYKEKGISRFQLTTHGTAAHASQPWLGDNAISRMGRLLDKLARLPTVPEIQSDDLTVCVSMIRGGNEEQRRAGPLSGGDRREIPNAPHLPQGQDDHHGPADGRGLRHPDAVRARSVRGGPGERKLPAR